MLDASFWEEKSTTAFVKILDARPMDILFVWLLMQDLGHLIM